MNWIASEWKVGNRLYGRHIAGVTDSPDAEVYAYRNESDMRVVRSGAAWEVFTPRGALLRGPAGRPRRFKSVQTAMAAAAA